jgi:hypothetical protein
VALAYGTPPVAPNLVSSNNGSYTISGANAQPVTGYEVHLRYILENSLSPSNRSNYSEPKSIKSIVGRTFTLSESEIGNFLLSEKALTSKYVILTVVATSDAGSSEHSNGFYIDSSKAGAALIVSSIEISGPKTIVPGSKGVFKIKILNGQKSGISGKTPVITHSGIGQFTQLQSTTQTDGVLLAEVSTSGDGEGQFTLTASLDGLVSSFEVQVKVVPEVKAVELTLPGFVGKSIKLTQAHKNKIKVMATGNENASKIVCTGYRLETQSSNLDSAMLSRAKAACAYAKTLLPNLDVVFMKATTRTKELSGKVRLSLEVPLR